MMRSAWIKWARAAEHQKVLARETQEFRTIDSYEYVRADTVTTATTRFCVCAGSSG